MSENEILIKEIIEIIKKKDFLTTEQLKNQILCNNPGLYSEELIEYVLLHHPNIKNSYGKFYWAKK